jgi:hypothetical protein
MKKSLLLVISICSLWLLNGCSGGSSSPPPPTPDIATHFSVTPATATPIAGTAFNFTVTALDGSNGVVSSYAGTVHFTSSDGQAVLPANSTLTSGTGTFSVTMKTVGGQTITATDAATLSITGTSNSINVTGPPATHFSVTAPATATTGTPFNFTVTPLDASNNVVTSYSGTVHFTSTDGQALLPGGSAPVNGTTQTFSATLKTVGSQTITATDTITASITGTSSSINVSQSVPAIETTPAPSAGALDLPYSFTFTATGGLPPLTWSETGAPPPGLGPLSNGGVLSGTPTEVGSFPITIMAQDSLGQNSAPQDFTISVFLHGFKATGSMYGARYGHTATLLNNGEVLVTGGSAGGPPRGGPPGPPTLLATAELFDPTSGTFTGTGSMSIVRIGHTATLLKNGKVLVTGGGPFPVQNGIPPYALASAELFDPTSGTFTPTTGSMSVGRYGHTATLLNNGTVLVTGGDNGLGALPTADLFDPTSETFTPTTGNMSVARVGHTATLLSDGRVLITGGGGNTAELFDPASETFTPTTGSMETARSYHTATLLDDGKVLVTGGVDSNNQALASAELFDPTTDTFTPTTGTMETVRSEHTATLLSDGTVLVAGGSGGTTAELFDPTSGTFTGTGSMQIARAGHTATLLKDGTVLVTGGRGVTGFVLAAAELYQ